MLIFWDGSVITFCMTENQISPEVRAYMSALGRKKSRAKVEAQKKNLAKGAAARRRDPLTLVCTCTGGDSLDVRAHKTTCPRGRLLHQRARSEARAWFEELAARGAGLSEPESGILRVTPSSVASEAELEVTRRLKPQLLAIVRRERAGVSEVSA